MADARYLVGDVFEMLATLEANSVDLVLTSPPFLALRSYLPADHPDKSKEIGSEATPAMFIDRLLDVVEALDRVLAPHGSICIELGDTYSGSGGAGGDYLNAGLRDGQPAFDGSASRGRAQTREYDGGASDRWDFAKPGTKSRSASGAGWPLDKSLCLIPESFRFALVYGHNPHNGRTTPRWRARNVIRWVRPNPPVGALGDKFRPATSEMVVLCKSRDRYFDLDAVRTAPLTNGNGSLSGYKPEGQPARMTWRTTNSAGAPPLDWWNIPTQHYSGSHYATWPEQLCITPIKAMSPPGGTVLDPFAGSGTTLKVATGHGRDAIGIDLDPRNADLAVNRIGPLFLTVEHREPHDIR